ncbi:hypothetical protein HaLaN_23775, partial [Haematococcus lacustris]
GGHSGAGHELDTQAGSGREGSDPTCRGRCSWATSVAAVSRGEARMSKNWGHLNETRDPLRCGMHIDECKQYNH